MYADRLKFYPQIEKERGSRLLVYFVGDKPGMETQIHPEVLDLFSDHVDGFGPVKRISLYLYSRGGNTLAGWSIVNLLRQFCDELEVIVPAKAHSTATLIAIGANKIIMTKQATLGPIDPSINGPLNPQAPGQPPHVRMPISVEDVTSYFELAKEELGIKGESDLSMIFAKLVEHVHPLALGSVYRAREQIRMLATRLLKLHMVGDEDEAENSIEKITQFLCSESGSHDYTINRREARTLGLPVETPSEEQYALIKSVYDDIRKELELGSRFDPNVILATEPSGKYEITRAVLESVSGGCHRFISKGRISKQTIQTPIGPQDVIKDERSYEGWEHETN